MNFICRFYLWRIYIKNCITKPDLS